VRDREETYGKRRAKAKITTDFLEVESWRLMTRKIERARRANSEVISKAATICQRRILVSLIIEMLEILHEHTMFGP
jgi:hypothetical protein